MCKTFERLLRIAVLAPCTVLSVTSLSILLLVILPLWHAIMTSAQSDTYEYIILHWRAGVCEEGQVVEVCK